MPDRDDIVRVTQTDPPASIKHAHPVSLSMVESHAPDVKERIAAGERVDIPTATIPFPTVRSVQDEVHAKVDATLEKADATLAMVSEMYAAMKDRGLFEPGEHRGPEEPALDAAAIAAQNQAEADRAAGMPQQQASEVSAADTAAEAPTPPLPPAA